MAYVGQTLSNPASGERITFRRTAAQTGGRLVTIDLELPQGRRVPGSLHIHPLQEERFEVVNGTMMKGIPRPLDLALFTREFEQEVQAALPPLWLQRLTLAPLAWLARRRGYDARYVPESVQALPEAA
jgi:hypothetical protein